MATGTPSFHMFCLQHPKQKLAAEEYPWKRYNTLRASLTTEHVSVSLGGEKTGHAGAKAGMEESLIR